MDANALSIFSGLISLSLSFSLCPCLSLLMESQSYPNYRERGERRTIKLRACLSLSLSPFLPLSIRVASVDSYTFQFTNVIGPGRSEGDLKLSSLESERERERERERVEL